MVDKIQKKIETFFIKAGAFFKKYLAYIVFLVFLFQLLNYFSSLPYINLINNYYYFVFALLWIIVLILFKARINNKAILLLALGIFILAIPASLTEIAILNESLGFIAFILLFTYVLRQIIAERKELRD